MQSNFVYKIYILPTEPVVREAAWPKTEFIAMNAAEEEEA